LVGRTIRVKKKVKGQDRPLPKDLLTHIIDFSKQNSRFILFAIVAAAVVIAGSFAYRSYREGRTTASATMEYFAADLYQQAMAIDLTPNSEAQQGEDEKTSLAERLDKRQSLLKKSVAQFEELQKAYPRARNIERVLLYIGIVRYQLADYQSALRAFQKCLKRFPDGAFSALCQANIARTQEQMGEPGAAVQSYEQLFKTQGNSPGIQPYYFNLAELYERMNKPDSAKEVYTKIASLYPGSQWEREANEALRHLEGPGSEGAGRPPKIGADLSKLPPGFDPSKVHRVVVGKDETGKRTVKVEKNGTKQKVKSQQSSPKQTGK